MAHAAKAWMKNGVGAMGTAAILLGAGVASADLRPPPELAPTTTPSRRVEGTRPTRLPDGLFVGKMEGAGAAAELQITVVAGRITEAFVRREAQPAIFDLEPDETGDSLELRLSGTIHSEFVRINGVFFDAERATGTFDGVLKRQKVRGTWVLARR